MVKSATAFSVVLDFTKLLAAVTKATFKNLDHAAASLRKDVIGTLKEIPGPSRPGTPPHTHKNKQLPRAIVYDVDGNSAIIGPRASFVGQSGHALELGGHYRDRYIAERAYMWPGLERAAPRFAADWEGSIGQ